MSVGVIVDVAFGFVLGLILRRFKGNGAVDRRLSNKLQEAKAQDARDKADEHPARKQASDHDEFPLIRNTTSRAYLPDVPETRAPAPADYF
jgi:hypothetical protein